eukprot:1144540-Pelagomonas_calceolata.AAC.12
MAPTSWARSEIALMSQMRMRGLVGDSTITCKLVEGRGSLVVGGRFDRCYTITCKMVEGCGRLIGGGRFIGCSIVTSACACACARAGAQQEAQIKARSYNLFQSPVRVSTHVGSLSDACWLCPPQTCALDFRALYKAYCNLHICHVRHTGPATLLLKF